MDRQVCGYIGKAAFSTALECRDLRRERGRDAVCLKVIKNNKDFFDQSLDEIKLLHRIKAGGDPVSINTGGNRWKYKLFCTKQFLGRVALSFLPRRGVPCIEYYLSYSIQQLFS